MRFFVLQLLLLIITTPCFAATTYADEIAVREQFVRRLEAQVKKIQQRMYVIDTTENEYQSCTTGVEVIDRRILQMRESGDKRLERSKLPVPYARKMSNAMTEQRLRDQMAVSLGIKIAGGKAALKSYRDLTLCVSFYSKKLPEMRRERIKLDKKLSKIADDRHRAIREIAKLKAGRKRAAGSKLLEGHWLLSGGGKNNLIYVRYSENDAQYDGTVIKSENLLCHPPGTILFSVYHVPGSDIRYQGIENGYDYSPNGRCKPRKGKLRLTINGRSMEYDNGVQRFILHRVDEDIKPDSLPMEIGRQPQDNITSDRSSIDRDDQEYLNRISIDGYLDAQKEDQKAGLSNGCRRVCAQGKVIWKNVSDGRDEYCLNGVPRAPGRGLKPPKCEKTIHCKKWVERCN